VLKQRDYVALSNFRVELARFLRFSEQASRAAGITPTQYLLLLHIRGHAGRDPVCVGELAERLQASPHGTTALIERSMRTGLVTKRRSTLDRRRTEVFLTPQGARLVARVASEHRRQLKTAGETT
jgi:DNA-binding MarR family transcriptional regulator